MRASSGIGFFVAALIVANGATAQEPSAPATPATEATAPTAAPTPSDTSPPTPVAEVKPEEKVEQPGAAAPVEHTQPAVQAEQATPADPVVEQAAPAEPVVEPAAPVEQAQPQPAMAEPAVVAEPGPPPETIETTLARRLGESKNDADIAAFYSARGNAPLWITDGKLTDKAKAVMARIARAGEDGLDADAFVLPDAAATDSSLTELASAELGLSHAAIAYARQAQGGRLIPSSLSPNITAEPQRPSPASVLQVMASNDDAADWLDSYNPPHAGFKALKAKLAELRSKAAGPTAAPPPVIPDGKLLKPGMKDERVAILRVRFGLPQSEDPTYDPVLVDAVKAFQAKADRKPDGIIGKATVQTMNGGPAKEDPTDLVLINMERWRWLPRDLGATHIMVNVPEYMARIIRDGQLAHETRVIVGKPQNQTPIFSDEMEFIIVNPAWNVPLSIASKEMLPNLIKDPTYLARQGIEVLDVSGKRAQVIDSTMVDWYSVNMKKIRFRQPPGERNALGHIKFMFPNKHSVYLHDTPTRGLFANATRSFSHGCVRVQDPFALADVLLEGTEWNAAKMKKLIGANERRIDLAHKVPIHIAYFTADTAEDGTLATRPDIYGIDRKMKAALGLGGQIQASARPR